MTPIKPIPIHSDMASRASTTYETVALVMSDLTKKGEVKREKTALVICDLAHLEAMVGDVRGTYGMSAHSILPPNNVGGKI